MVATQKLYPRGTVKRIVKAHAGRNISKNADVLVRLFFSSCCNPRFHELLSVNFATDISRLYAFHARVSDHFPVLRLDS